MTKKIHISLNTTNINKSVSFYQELFGVAPVKLRADYAKFDLVEPALNLTLNRSDKVEGNKVSHLGVQMTSSSDVFTEKTRLEGLGHNTHIEEKTDCCYALQDKVWLKDPDGNAWEIFVVLMDKKESENERSNCCA